MSQTPVERASGGVVVRVRNGQREVLLIDDQYGRISFPKGHVEALESWETAALREVYEETGIAARILSPLGRVEYAITRGGQTIRKQVRIFLMEALSGETEPVAQLEELPAAYYLPWPAADEALRDLGYDNWSWLLTRAAVECDWHDGGWETRWRKLPLDTPFTEIAGLWQSIQPLFERQLAAVQSELAVCAADWTYPVPVAALPQWPISIADEQAALAAALEHTLLRPTASVLDVERVCDEAREYNLHAICVHAQHVAAAAWRLRQTDVAVCTVVGFPLGAGDTRGLQAEVAAAIAAGAREIDMVIPIGSMCEDDIWTVFQYVACVTRTAKMTQGVAVKVILETHFLTHAQVLKACLVAAAAGADFVKTSTGFAEGGATVADVVAMVHAVGNALGVKAAGGVRSRAAALNLLRLGATRIGSSASLQIMRA